MLELVLKRQVFYEDATLGMLKLNGVEICHTLEPTQREDGVKIKGKTAIPRGRYRLLYRYSQKFGANRYFLLDVPNFTGIMIHEGNSSKDTQGCILVGMENVANKLLHSKKALNMLHNYFKKVQLQGENEIYITID